VEVEKDAMRIAARNNRPFPTHPKEIDGSELNVMGYGPDAADIVEALTPLVPGPARSIRCS
jgi:hypothetical protein